jgi:PAS domain S-box-containing protein
MKENNPDDIKKYIEVFETLGDAISIQDREYKVLYQNDAHVEMIGRHIGEYCYKAYEKRSQRCEECPIALSFEDGGRHDAERIGHLDDGEHIHVEIISSPIRDSEGNIIAGIETVRDVTSHKHAEYELAKSERFLNITFDAIQDGISVLDADLNVIRVNKIMREWYAHMLPFEGKRKCYEVYHGRSRPCEVCPTIRAIKSGKLEMEEVPFVKAEGVTGTLELFSYPIIGESGEITGVVEYVRDITDQQKAQKILEEETIKVQKLESTGILAGGIAHDFNNILTAILGNISMAKIFAESNEKVLKSLIQAEKAARRAQDLSQQLLTFSRGGDPIRKPTKITELLKDSASFSLTGSNVTCNLFMADKLWPVNIDEGQISQVIQNVVKNADQAMPDGGTIIIQAENKTINGKNMLSLKDGKYVWITIKDQGGGIPKKHIGKIFDPYFSTKQEGSGLGLAASFSIVKKHDGHISAESEPGEGTTFHIYLPASEKVSPVKKRAKEKLLQSGEKILIMDDDQAVLEIATQMLNMMGFKTETATNGQEAVALYKKAQKDGRPFGVVMLDLTIPGGMGGKETMKQLVHIDPGVKAIVSSGYANDPIMADYKSFGFSSVVSKPYNIEKLGEALRVFFC